MHLLEQLQDKKLALRGYGKEGKATYNFLIQKNFKPQSITIIDQDQDLDMPTDTKRILGKSDINRDDFDYIIKSAGISLYKNKLENLRHKTISATQIFLSCYTGSLIAITGTKGKTTITQLAYNLLKEAGYKVQIAGNIGLPLLSQLDNQYKYFVCEFSSYMLEDLQPSTYISICNNLYHEHHIQWHGSLYKYFKAKANILEKAKHKIVSQQAKQELKKQKIRKNEREKNIHIFGGNNQSDFFEKDDYFFHKSKQLFTSKQVGIPGKHNKDNISAIIAIAKVMEIPLDIVEHTLNSFKGIEHRLEFVGTTNQIHRYNDAISTTPESTIAAIESFPNQVDTLFLGGKDGGYDFSNLLEKIIENQIKNIILFPDTGVLIKKQLLKKYSEANIYETDQMKEAVLFANRYTQKGKIALLSCASPSYSLWKNFEEKGTLFKKHISELENIAG